MRSAEFLQRCLDAGMPMEMAMKALAAFDEQVPHIVSAALEHGRSKARERQQRHRLSRDKRDNENPADDVTLVTSDNVTSRDKRDSPRARVGDNNLPTEGPCRTDDDEEARGGADWPKGSASAWAQSLVEVCASSKLDLAKEPGLTISLGRLPAWRAAGASWEFDVLPVVKGTVAKAKKPIRSWTYFEAAVLESAAINRQALAIPAAPNVTPIRPGTGPPSITDRIAEDNRRVRAGLAAEMERRRGRT